MIFRKLFSRMPEQSNVEQSPTAAEETGASIPPEAATPEETMPPIESVSPKTFYQRYQLFSGYGYSIGCHREKNQDSIFTFSATLATNDNEIPVGLYIVADGMGGHELGEVASGAAVRATAGVVMENLTLPLIRDLPELQNIEETLRQAVAQARDMVLSQAPEGGTTLTLALIIGNVVYIAHIGDSRAYIIQPPDSLNIITRDHSLVKRLEELGQITPEEAATHPQRNVLYRALGQGEQTEAEISRRDLPSNGFLLLCSDGLWGVVPPENLMKIIQDSSHPAEACRRLIRIANEAGGPDNISLVLVQVFSEESI